MAIKYFSEMKTAAPEDTKAPVAPPPPAPAEGLEPTPDAPPAEAPKAPAPEEAPKTPRKETPSASPEKDAVKFKLQAEQKAKEYGHNVTVTISSTNKTMSIALNAEDDIITQKDALKLAVALEDLDPNWRLMDEPLVKAGPSWAIKMAKNK